MQPLSKLDRIADVFDSSGLGIPNLYASEQHMQYFNPAANTGAPLHVVDGPKGL
jgi:hypothetical protein